MARADLLRQLATIAVDLDAVAAPAAATDQLRALCRSARLAFSAAAASIAVLDGDRLRYLAADGAGADEIVGVVLPVGRGVAGYVAATGQAMAIDHLAGDARFARDVAERTGYVPDSLLVTPISAPGGDVAGVLSVLDRAPAPLDALALASSFAAQAALVLPVAEAARRGARLLLGALVEAAGRGEPTLAPALDRALRDLPDSDEHLARVVALLAELEGSDAGTRARVATILDELTALVRSRRRR